MRKTFQAIYGSWAGTLVAAGKSDEEVRDLLESSAPGIDSVAESFGEAAARDTAHRARAVVLANLPTIRSMLGPKK